MGRGALVRPDIIKKIREEDVSLEENKKVALELVSRLSEKRVKEAFELFTDDGTWWSQPSGPNGGAVLPKAIMEANIAAFMKALVSFRLEPVGVTAEGDRVAVEIQGYGKMITGQDYNNTYHLLMEIEDGRVKALREYCDSGLIAKVLTPEMRERVMELLAEHQG